MTIPTMPELFGSTEADVKELNNIIKAKSSLLEPQIMREWFALWSLYQDYKEEKEAEREKEIVHRAAEQGLKLVSTIKDIMNNKLIPKYRKIVGETVPDLE